MTKISKEKQIHLALVGAGVLGIMAALWFCVITPQKNKVQDIDRRTDKAKSEYEKEKKIIAGLAQLGQELSVATNRLGQIEAGMPSGDLYSWIVGAIKQFNIPSYKVDLHQFSSPSAGDVRMFADFPYSQATVSVTGTAYYYDFGKFVADFENRFPYMRVQNLSLEPMVGLTPQDREKLYFKMEIVTLVKPNAPLVANQ